MRVKWLASPSQLVLEAEVLEKRSFNAVVRAMRKTGEFGRTAVERTIAKTSPKPVATNTYRLSWASRHTKRGAVLGASARHAVFVEVGRRPGKAPPLNAILEWVKVKKITPRFVVAAATERLPRAQRPRVRSASATLNALGRKYDPRPSRPTPAKKKVSKARRKAKKKVPKKKVPKKKRITRAEKAARAAKQLEAAQRHFAWLVQRKIAEEGTPGRYVLSRTMPVIQKYANKQIRAEIKRIL